MMLIKQQIFSISWRHHANLNRIKDEMKVALRGMADNNNKWPLCKV